MVREPATVGPEETLGTFMEELVWARRHTTYPVVDDGRALGLLVFRSVAAVPRSEWDSRCVRDVMVERERVPAFVKEEELVDALVELGESDISRGLVLEGDRLVGLLSITDVARAHEVGPPPLRRRRGSS